MIKGIQITQAANDNLLNSFWLLDSFLARLIPGTDSNAAPKTDPAAIFRKPRRDTSCFCSVM